VPEVHRHVARGARQPLRREGPHDDALLDPQGREAARQERVDPVRRRTPHPRDHRQVMPAFEQLARVYIRRDGKRLIVTTVHYTPDGILVEAEGPLSLTAWNDEELGESIQTALEQSTTFTQEFPGAPPTY